MKEGNVTIHVQIEVSAETYRELQKGDEEKAIQAMIRAAKKVLYSTIAENQSLP
jgi:hypothetical protein